MVTLNIQQSEIVKMVVHFSKQLHIIFLYTKPSCARYVSFLNEMNQILTKTTIYCSYVTDAVELKEDNDKGKSNTNIYTN